MDSFRSLVGQELTHSLVMKPLAKAFCPFIILLKFQGSWEKYLTQTGLSKDNMYGSQN
jgi:hypothetical protein